MFKRLVQRIIANPTYVRVVKALIRNAIVHEKSEKFRRDVVSAIAAHEFERRELANVHAFSSYSDLVDAAVEATSPDRDVWVELGVMTGNSARLIAETARRFSRNMTLHGFDSFEGLPEDWHARAKKGAFAITPPTFSQKNIVIHKGLFDATLPIFSKELHGTLGFIHIDSDLYSSAKTAFDNLGPFISPGTVILFDEYWNYLEFADHEIKAFNEFIVSRGLTFKYIGYYKDHMQLAVIIT